MSMMSTKDGIGLGRDACQELSSALLTRGKWFSAELSGADPGIGDREDLGASHNTCPFGGRRAPLG